MPSFAVRITFDEDFIRIQFPYDQFLNETLKRITREAGYAWDSATRTWLVPISRAAIEAVTDWSTKVKSLGAEVVVELAPALLRKYIEAEVRKYIEAEVPVQQSPEYGRHSRALNESIPLVEDTIRKFTLEGRRKFGSLWDQD